MSDHITSEKDERLWSHTSEYSLGVMSRSITTYVQGIINTIQFCPRQEFTLQF